MLYLYKIDGNTLQIVSCPLEDIRKGDYLLVDDNRTGRGLIVQVINSGFANVPGILEDILRQSSTEEVVGVDVDVLNVKSYIHMVKDAQLFTCKVRRAIEGEKLSNDISWTPSRSTSKITKLSDESLLRIAKINRGHPLEIGVTKEGALLSIDASNLDGKLNVITGRKETGKSHFSKLLVLGLISYGGICIVLDVNGEYVNLGYSANCEKGKYYDKILVLTPGQNFKVTLQYAGLGVILDIMCSVLDLPATSAWELRRIWSKLIKNHSLSLKQLEDEILNVKNDFIRDALLRRYESLQASSFFTDNPYGSTTLEECLTYISNGGALIINLRNLPNAFRRIIVELLLSKLSYLLENEKLRAVFLFAEEAHLYLQETYWDDIVTRMRHLGIYTTFVTNQPDSIKEGVYRQADNIFIFNFTNEHDLEIVSRAAKVDAETVNIIARELPPHHCLILGKAVNDFPLIVKVNPLAVITMGKTRYFFNWTTD